MSNPVPDREPIEPPEGFEPKPRPADPPPPESRPDWLVGADDGTDFGRREHGPRPTLSRPGGGSFEGPPAPPPPRFRLEVPPQPPPEAPEETQAEAWAAAASSVPRLTVSSRERPSTRETEEYEEPATLGRLEPQADTEGTAIGGEGETAPEAVQLPHDPWWLIAVETLATNRPLQIGIAAVLVALAAWTFWPRRENQTTAIAAIKKHPERFEGQPVRIRGEVGEVFDVGSGVVFQLHQHRDTMVVFSPNRRPAPHERLIIAGTVSTGYLDGTPRVALFESPGAAPTP